MAKSKQNSHSVNTGDKTFSQRSAPYSGKDKHMWAAIRSDKKCLFFTEQETTLVINDDSAIFNYMMSSSTEQYK